MAKRVTKRANEPEAVSRICDDCAHCEWVQGEHPDLHGRPVLLACRYSAYERVRGAKACENWKRYEH